MKNKWNRCRNNFSNVNPCFTDQQRELEIDYWLWHTWQEKKWDLSLTPTQMIMGEFCEHIVQRNQSTPVNTSVGRFLSPTSEVYKLAVYSKLVPHYFSLVSAEG